MVNGGPWYDSYEVNESGWDHIANWGEATQLVRRVTLSRVTAVRITLLFALGMLLLCMTQVVVLAEVSYHFAAGGTKKTVLLFLIEASMVSTHVTYDTQRKTYTHAHARSRCLGP